MGSLEATQDNKDNERIEDDVDDSGDYDDED